MNSEHSLPAQALTAGVTKNKDCCPDSVVLVPLVQVPIEAPNLLLLHLQVCAPLYKLVVSAAGGERRFAAAVARRLQSLGALTRGDRRAAAGIDLSESNFDSPWGRKSLRKMYDHIGK